MGKVKVIAFHQQSRGVNQVSLKCPNVICKLSFWLFNFAPFALIQLHLQQKLQIEGSLFLHYLNISSSLLNLWNHSKGSCF